MAILTIKTYPDPVLTRPSKEISSPSRTLVALAESMAETMYHAENGVGLAAPQVGKNVRLVVVDSDPENNRGTPLFLFNPHLVELNGQEVKDEGCLSLPGYYAPVSRATSVVVEAMDREGRPIRLPAQGLLARCLQHEIDHLDGRLVLDYVSPLKRALYRKRAKKEQKKAGS